MGLYLLAAFVALLGVGGWFPAAGPVLATATTVTGVAGMSLLAIGAVGLLLRRLTDPALRAHSAPADFFNLILFVVAAGLGLVTFATVDRDFSILRAFVASALTWGPSFELPALVAAEIVVGAVLVTYIPLTHMSHFFTKWFTYHDVRWNDEVNRVGGKLEAAIGRQLGHKVSWCAPHIAGEGKKTWVDVATEEVGKP
jgi:nitrate reductase gamma subunit